VAQYKKGRHYAYVQGKWHYERKQSGYGEQTKPIFQEKLKSIKRCKHFELGGFKKIKGQVIQF